MSDQDVERGSQMGEEMIRLIAARARRASDPVHFWAGLFASLAGAASAQIGTEVTRVLAESAGELAGQEAAKAAN